MVNLLVVSGSKEEAFQYILIAKELVNQNIMTHIVASRRHVYQFIKSKGWEHTIPMTIKKSDMSKRIDSYQYLIKYQNPTIAEMITSEQAVAKLITKAKGGEGVIRELSDFII